MKFYFSKWRIMAFSILLAFAGLGLSNTEVLQAKWNDWRLEERTELYFEPGSKLPETYTPGKSGVFSFSFLNQENESVNYSIKITAVGKDGKSKLIGTGETIARHNQIGTVSPSYTLPDLGKRVKATVKMDYSTKEDGPMAKSISFWMDKESE